MHREKKTGIVIKSFHSILTIFYTNNHGFKKPSKQDAEPKKKKIRTGKVGRQNEKPFFYHVNKFSFSDIFLKAFGGVKMSVIKG